MKWRKKFGYIRRTMMKLLAWLVMKTVYFAISYMCHPGWKLNAITSRVPIPGTVTEHHVAIYVLPVTFKGHNYNYISFVWWRAYLEQVGWNLHFVFHRIASTTLAAVLVDMIVCQNMECHAVHCKNGAKIWSVQSPNSLGLLAKEIASAYQTIRMHTTPRQGWGGSILSTQERFHSYSSLVQTSILSARAYILLIGCYIHVSCTNHATQTYPSLCWRYIHLWSVLFSAQKTSHQD